MMLNGPEQHLGARHHAVKSANSGKRSQDVRFRSADRGAKVLQDVDPKENSGTVGTVRQTHHR